MIRYLTLSVLRNEPTFSEVIECHRQTWTDGSEWKGYEHAPRFADGLMLVCSEIRVLFIQKDGTILTAQRGDLVYAPEGARYLVRFLGGGHGIDVYTVNFRLKDTAGNLLRFGDGLSILTNGAPPDCYTLLSRLADTCLTPEENTLRKHSELFALFDAINEEISSRSEEYYPIRRGARLLRKEWNQNRPISDYAEICGISETGFYQHFKTWAGIPPAEYRTQMRISAARSLLRNSSFQISEIAAQIGFDDPYYFSRVFKKNVGLSPRAFRNAEESPPASSQNKAETEETPQKPT